MEEFLPSPATPIRVPVADKPLTVDELEWKHTRHHTTGASNLRRPNGLAARLDADAARPQILNTLLRFANHVFDGGFQVVV